MPAGARLGQARDAIGCEGDAEALELEVTLKPAGQIGVILDDRAAARSPSDRVRRRRRPAVELFSEVAVLRRGSAGQLDDETSAASKRILDPRLPAERADELTNNGEADTTAGRCVVIALLEPNGRAATRARDPRGEFRGPRPSPRYALRLPRAAPLFAPGRGAGRTSLHSRGD